MPLVELDAVVKCIPDGALLAVPPDYSGVAMAATRALITGRAAFSLDRTKRRFRLDSVHPGHDAAEVVAQTGFAFDRPAEVPLTPAPPATWLTLVRGQIGDQVAETYPRFAAATQARAAGAAGVSP